MRQALYDLVLTAHFMPFILDMSFLAVICYPVHFFLFLSLSLNLYPPKAGKPVFFICHILQGQYLWSRYLL